MDEAEAEAEAAGNEEPMQEDQEPRSAPSSSSRMNEDNFQLVLGRLDSLTTSIGNMQTSIDNFSTMVTKRFSTYDEHFGTLETSIEEINERLINQRIQLFVFDGAFVFDDAEGIQLFVFDFFVFDDVEGIQLLGCDCTIMSN